jgi:hypothetical protein
MWMDFQSDNLRVRLERPFVATDSSQALPPPLDLWGWYMLGLVRCNPIIACSSTEHRACLFHHNNIKLFHLVLLGIAFLFLNRSMSPKFTPQNQTTIPTVKVTISWLCTRPSRA